VKSGRRRLTLELRPTKDILAECGEQKRKGQFLVGFAAETEDVLGHAREKLEAKHLDLIVANDVSRAGVGFESDSNAGYLLLANGTELEVPKMDKRAFAESILNAVVEGRDKKGRRRRKR